MIHLILGGRRSGKTAFAEQCALTASRDDTVPLYIATAEAFDNEMSDRIHAHKTSRGDAWRTAEVPLHLDTAILGLTKNDIVVIDCLTVWVTNLMVHGINQEEAIEQLCEALKQSAAQIFLVSNETSLGGILLLWTGRIATTKLGSITGDIIGSAILLSETAFLIGLVGVLA